MSAYILTYTETVEPLLNSIPDTLPEPDADAKARSKQVQQCVVSACEQAGGKLRFPRFMEIALYQPGMGYYTGGLQKFGDKGDFITAPEVSPLFGQCLAKQIAQVLQGFENAGAKNSTLLEFGAGSGILAADILLALAELDTLPAKYLILELSAELQQRQQQKIKECAPQLYERVEWLTSIPDNLDNVVVIANEVLDAMPVECFRVSGDEVQSLVIAQHEDGLVANYVKADAAVEQVIETIKQRSEIEFLSDYRSEYNPAIKPWLTEL